MKISFRADNRIEISGYVNAVERDSRQLPPNMASDMTTDFVEQIGAGVFARSLQKHPAVKCLFNHGNKIADTEDGTLHLHEDSIGLFARAVISDEEAVTAAKHGKLTGWSFGFNCDSATITDTQNPNVKRRHVDELCLQEVSLLTIKPAYYGTSVEYRGAENGLLERRSAEDAPEPVELSEQESKDNQGTFVPDYKKQFEIFKLMNE